MVKNDFTLEEKATICDKVFAGKTEEDRTARREKLAQQYKVSLETINAITAHITIRMNEAVGRVKEIIQQRKLRIKHAWEGMIAADKRGLVDAQEVEGQLAEREDEVKASKKAFERLQQEDLRGAIDVFAEAGDTEALEAIAAVYGPSRPDLAAMALRAAGRIDGVLELVALQLRAGGPGTRAIVKRILAEPRSAAGPKKQKR